MIHRQDNFVGGMLALFDSSKVGDNQYRIGLNCRVRKNAVVGTFAPVRIESPAAVHQTIFSIDDKLVTIIAGAAYNINIDTHELTTLDNFPALSSTADVVYHAEVPAPTNFLVNNTYAPAVADYVEAAVLQDGVSQPPLIFSDLSSRVSQDYAAWDFNNPEYVPIGRQMAVSGNVLFIASPDGKRIYRSVSGRPLDFVLRLNTDTGAKLGDANASYLAVSAAQLTALTAAQNGGLITNTRYATHALIPDSTVELQFGEIYLRPTALFPVGAVNHLSFTVARGESVFVAPAGIQSFNQTEQFLTSSNNSPFGAPIIDFIELPITRCATIAVDDYTFFGLRTIFGDGILVYDNRIGQFVSIDLVGAVKEFAIVNKDGRERLFYITHTNELFELPLYAGTRRPFSIYFGEHSSHAGNLPIKPRVVHLGFNGIRRSGSVAVELYGDRSFLRGLSQELTVAGTAYDSTPVSFPLEGERKAAPLSFNFNEIPFVHTAGIAVTCAADARLTSIVTEFTVKDEPAAPQVSSTAVTVLVLGNVNYDSRMAGATYAEVTPGAEYVFYATAAGAIMNGDEQIELLEANQSKVFTARADLIQLAANQELISYARLSSQIRAAAPSPDHVFIIGNAGHVSRHTPIKAILNHLGVAATVKTEGVIGPADQSDKVGRASYFSVFARPIRYRVPTEYVDFYMFSPNLAEDDIDLDDDGALTGTTPDEFQSTGPFARWLATTIANLANGRINVACIGYPPYASGAPYAPGFAALRWNWKRLGVSLVISTESADYYRTYQDGVHFVNIDHAHATLQLRLQSNLIQATVKSTAGDVVDMFTVTP